MRASRRLRVGPLVGLLCVSTGVHACAETHPNRTCRGAACAPTSGGAGAAPDSGTADARAGAAPADAAAASEAELQPLSACVTRPQDAPFAPAMVVSTLASLCAATAAAGIADCPEDRADYLRSLDPECRPGGTFPVFDRRCGVDHVFWSNDDGTIAWWYFDAAGALIGARLLLRSDTTLPCAATVYRAGAELPDCGTSDGSCSLCVAEPDQCPADISAALATAACAPAAPEAPACSCGDGNSSSGLSFADHLAPCGLTDQCAHCAGGTCWADCRCLRTGERRYVLQCTE